MAVQVLRCSGPNELNCSNLYYSINEYASLMLGAHQSRTLTLFGRSGHKTSDNFYCWEHTNLILLSMRLGA